MKGCIESETLDGSALLTGEKNRIKVFMCERFNLRHGPFPRAITVHDLAEIPIGEISEIDGIGHKAALRIQAWIAWHTGAHRIEERALRAALKAANKRLADAGLRPVELSEFMR